MKELRIIEKKVDQNWVAVRMSDLKKGDTFRMWEPYVPPELVVYDGLSEFLADSDGYMAVIDNKLTGIVRVHKDDNENL